MRLRLASLLVALLLTLSGCWAGAKSQDIPVQDLVPTQRQQRTLLVINQALERFDYRKVSLNDDFAEKVLKQYIKALDPNRSYFLQGDIDRFKRGVDRLDDDLARGKLDTAFEIFRLYRQRADERARFAISLLDKGFDFDRPESYRFDRTKAEYAKTPAELDEIWRKRVKNDWLGLRLSNKEEAKIPQLLRQRYEGLARQASQVDSNDVFAAFVNAYAESVEPHTSYMSPSSSENFDINMRLSLEGIGAVLRAENEYTVVQSTVHGGPAEHSGQVHAGDRIVGVAQGLDGAMEDVIGWRLQDVVERIRGPKGSLVRLQILPKSAAANNKTREVSIVRNEIKLDDQAAKSYVIDDLGSAPDRRIGVIQIPAFYRDFRGESNGEKNFRSTTRDVRALIRKLVRQGVDGILVDLRDNGGGSLTEATELTGLFIDKGPVVQVKDSFGKVEVETDPDPGILYSGPLAVLVNGNSASASEIFAGAIKDYGRGIIIGEPTFGKGTVQTLLDLNRFLQGEHDDLGRLRLTMAEFFRVNGSSTQLRGVTPDIRFPEASDSGKHGERALDNPLPWAKIEPVSHTQGSLENSMEWLRQRSEQRTRQDAGFKMLVALQKALRKVEDQTVVSLREQDRRVESQRREHMLKDQLNAFLRTRGVEPVDEDAEDVDQKALEKQQEIIQRIEAEEAARILADAISLDLPARQWAVVRD